MEECWQRSRSAHSLCVPSRSSRDTLPQYNSVILYPDFCLSQWWNRSFSHFTVWNEVLNSSSSFENISRCCVVSLATQHLFEKSSLLHPVPLTFQLPRSFQDWFKSSSWSDLVLCIPSLFVTQLSHHSQGFKARGIKQCGRTFRGFVSVGFVWSSPAVQVRAAVISALSLNVCFSSCHREICQCVSC